MFQTEISILRYVIHPVSRVPLITVELRDLPRSVLADITRHRSCSFCVAGSRAANSKATIQRAKEDTYIPRPFLKNAKGMGGLEELPTHVQHDLTLRREVLLDFVVCAAEREISAGVKKEQVNRLLEPFIGCDLIFSTTGMEELLALRCAPDVDNALRIPMIDLADKLCSGMICPEFPKLNSWSMPYLREEEESLPLTERLIRSAARCGRVATGGRGESLDFAADCRTFLLFVGALREGEKYCSPTWDKKSSTWNSTERSTLDNLHASPLEQQVLIVPMDNPVLGNYGPGFCQFRHMPKLVEECKKVALAHAGGGK